MVIIPISIFSIIYEVWNNGYKVALQCISMQMYTAKAPHLKIQIQIVIICFHENQNIYDSKIKPMIVW